jgi:hypothetical protein
MQTELYSFSSSQRHASCSNRLTPEDSVCCTNGARRCGDASAGLDVLKKRKFSLFYQQSKQTSAGVQDGLFEMKLIQCILADTDRLWVLRVAVTPLAVCGKYFCSFFVVSCAVPVGNVSWMLVQEGRSSNLRRGVGQAAHTRNNSHVKCTGFYCTKTVNNADTNVLY